MKKYITCLVVVTSLLMWGCNSSGSKEQPAAEAEHEHVDGDGHDHSEHAGHSHGEEDDGDVHAHGEEIHFSAEQAQSAGLKVENVVAGSFRQVIKTSGEILAAQGDETLIVATTNGVVSFVNPSITEGDRIQSGQALATISSKNLLDGDPAAKAKAEYETARSEFRRAEELIKDSIISVKEYEQSRLRYETAKTTYDAQAGNHTANGVKVTSPIGGYLKSLMAGQGEYVSVGQPIALVSKNKRLQLKAEVPERYFETLGNIQCANFRMAYGQKLYKLSEMNGRIVSFGKTAGGASFFIPVTFEFDNVGGVIPGTFAEIYLLSSPRDNVISVPISALTEEQGLYFVYLQLDEEGYKKQEVSVGQSDGDRVEILSGLMPGQKVVTQGGYQVKLAAVSSVMPEGHSHNH